MSWETKSNHHEYLESIAFYLLPTFGSYRQGLWLFRHRLFIVALWLGSRRYCSLGHLEQSEELVFSPEASGVFSVQCSVFSPEVSGVFRV